MPSKNKTTRATAMTAATRNPVSESKGGFLYSSVVVGVTATFMGLMLMIANIVNKIQPVPYLDEIYHIPQAVQYCHGNFSHWDDRITTLPGLYLISIGVLHPLSQFVGRDLCDYSNFRFTNIVLSMGNFFLYVWMMHRIHHNDHASNQWKRLISALNMALFPPLFFFAFLYYTDVPAVCLVFLMYSLHLDGRNKLAAMAGILAILVRQTSIVWTVFVAVSSLDASLQHHLLSQKERNNSEVLSSWRQLQKIVERFFRLTPFSVKIRLITQLISDLLAYVIVGILFVAFVLANGGLVVGDRTAHQATINVPQIFYCFGLIVVFVAPHCLLHIRPFLYACLKKWYVALLASLAAALIVHYNTVVHPYLLADNRHYTFYVWKRVYEYHPLGRYVVIPLYLFGAYVTYKTMAKKSFICTWAFLACSCIALVPQKLLEIRYFFIPILLLRLHISPRLWSILILELIMYAVLNAATLYLFMYRPFYWTDSPLVQRFMW